MKKTVIILAVLAGSMGVALSWFLMPSNSEVALMRFKDKHYDQALKDYEQLWRQGGRSVSVVVPLTRLYLAYGEVDKAVQLMEEFVARHPDQVEARRQLGKYYQYAQRPHDYLRNLETLIELSPGEREFRELSDGLNYTGRYQRQIEVIESIIRLYPGKAQDYIDLAHLQAALGRVQDAFATMDQLRREHPRAVNREVLELLLSLALDAHRPEEALTLVQQWLAENHDPNPGTSRRKRRQYEQIASLAGLFRFKEARLQALRLLRPYENAVGEDSGLLMQLSELELELGLPAKTYHRLKGLEEAGGLPERVHPLYLRAALALNREDEALRLASRLALRRAPDWLMAEMVGKALEKEQPHLAQQLASSRRGDFLAAYPLLGAELALVRGDSRDLGHWLDRALASPLGGEKQLHLAYLMQRAGRAGQAVQVLEDALRSGRGLDNAPGLAVLYQQTGQARRGYLFFHNLRQHYSHRQVQAAWALMALGQDQRQSVRRWLEGLSARASDIQWLSTLGYQAMQAGASGVAERAARYWVRLEPVTESRLLLAEALSANGRADEALQILRPLADELAPAQRGAYQEALTRAWRLGLPVEEELVGFWARRLDHQQAESDGREDAVYALLELRRPALVLEDLFRLTRRQPEEWLFALQEACQELSCRDRFLDFLESEVKRKDLPLPRRRPHVLLLAEGGRRQAALPDLKRLARLQAEDRLGSEGDDADWDFLYQEALVGLQRRQELLEYWQRKAGRPQTSLTEKRSIAFRMLEELQARDEAVKIFRSLAEDEGPQGENVELLLFLWGRPLPGRERDWLGGRVRRSASAEEMAGWLQRLLEAGEARTAAELAAKARGVPGDWSLVADVRLEALSQAGMRDRLTKLLEREIRLARRLESWERLAKLAVDNELPSQAHMAYQRVLQQDSTHPAALDWMGRHYFGEGRYSEAEQLLLRLHSQGDAGFESAYYLAEMLSRRGEREEASHLYADALLKVQRAIGQGFPHRNAGFAAEALQAMLFFRTGRRSAAHPQFRRLLRERPYASHLRADYAGLLLEEDLARAAQLLIEQRPALKDAGRAGAGWMSELEQGQAELRLRLMQSQALAAQGRLGDALKALTRLHRRHPDNAQVATQRAYLERRILRTRRALTISAQALMDEPENEDLLELRRQLLRETASQAGPSLELKSVQDAQHEIRLSVQAQHHFSPAWTLRVQWEQNIAQADQAGLGRGTLESLDGVLQRGRLEAGFEREDGTRLTAGLLIGDQGPGAAFSWQRPDTQGVTWVRAEYNRPSWEYVEGLANGLGRDRLQVERRQRVAQRWESWFGAAFNRYRSGDFDPAAESWAWQGRLQYEIREERLYAAYGVEAEYESSSAQGIDRQGQPFRPLSLSSREVHFFDLSWFNQIGENLKADAYGGFSWDRLGGSGPFVGASFDFDPPGPLKLGAWADQRLNSVDTGQKETRLGIRILWSFERR